MANSIALAPLETKPSVRALETVITGEALPLEQRINVTVDEPEKLSLPFPAELYDERWASKCPILRMV